MLDILLNAARPYKKFSVKIGDTTVDMRVRKPGAIEANKISEAWTDAYEKAKARIEKEAVDTNLLARNLSRQKKERLAQYIARADRLDLAPEAQMLCDDKPLDDPMVVAKLDELVADREKELNTLEFDTLLSMAMERRTHIQALVEAQAASIRTSIVLMVYRPDTEEVAFANEDELGQLPEAVIEDIFEKAGKALEEPAVSPLT